MQEQQVLTFGNEKPDLSPSAQHFLNHLEKVWNRPIHPSPEMLKQITEFLSQLPEPYQVLGMTKIAEYLTSEMSLHFIHLLATFQQKSKDEGIDSEELTHTLRGAVLELLPEMMGISKQVLIKSLEDLVTLSNITFGLHTLSQSETAEEAQSWIYELPISYMRQLRQEHLITSIPVQFTITQTVTAITISGSFSWQSSLPSPVVIDTTQKFPLVA